METVVLVLGLAKLALEVFQDERRGKFQRQLNKLEKEWMDEMSLPDDRRSDLTLDRIMFECNQLANNIIFESSKK